MFKWIVGFGTCLGMVLISVVGGHKLLAAEVSSRANKGSASSKLAAAEAPAVHLATELGVEFVKDSASTLILKRAGKEYLVDLAGHTISEVEPPNAVATSGATPGKPLVADTVDGSAIFKQKCSTCHGDNGKGISAIKTPDFTDAKVQASITDEQILATIRNGKKDTLMAAWAGKLSEQDIKAVAEYVRSLGTPSGSQPTASTQGEAKNSKIYEPGDDVLFTLPTGRRLSRHGFYINFAHRFAFDPAFSGPARGGALLGLDGFAIPSFGFRYGVTDKLSVSIFRAPSIIARPIQVMAAYNLLDEHDGKPFNMAVRFSVEGENSFLKNYTENFEGVFSRSLTSRAQIYVVPTLSLNDRPLQQVFTYSSHDILDFPGHSTFSLGIGGALDIRPTAALVAEVIPTLVNGRPLGIHRPAYAFGIQKKIWRHSFTFGFTTSPGTTVSQRAGTRASFLGDPAADKPSGLVIGFDLTRQIY